MFLKLTMKMLNVVNEQERQREQQRLLATTHSTLRTMDTQSQSDKQTNTFYIFFIASNNLNTNYKLRFYTLKEIIPLQYEGIFGYI